MKATTIEIDATPLLGALWGAVDGTDPARDRLSWTAHPRFRSVLRNLDGGDGVPGSAWTVAPEQTAHQEDSLLGYPLRWDRSAVSPAGSPVITFGSGAGT